MSEFKNELQKLINIYSKEQKSNTPDFILAEYLCLCLETFDRVLIARSKYYDPKNTSIIEV